LTERNSIQDIVKTTHTVSTNIYTMSDDKMPVIGLWDSI